MPTPAEAGLYVGATLSRRFVVGPYFARGGFSLLFDGTDLLTGRAVAIKILALNPSPDAILEFQNEAVLLANLNGSSNVVELIASDSDTVLINPAAGGVAVPLTVHFMALERAEKSLADLVILRHTIIARDRLSVYRDVVKGVHQVHLGNIRHRDIKSENALIFMGPRKMITAKVNDLGRSRDLSLAPRFPTIAYIVGRGDFRFAPPEALWCQLPNDDPALRRADLYMLGSVLYELFTGQALTSSAFVNPQLLAFTNVHRVPAITPQEYRSQVAVIRAIVSSLIDTCDLELPPVIRNEAKALMRQLCDPDPSRRERGYGRDDPTVGLNWLLTRVDVLIKRIDHAENKTRRPGRRSASA